MRLSSSLAAASCALRRLCFALADRPSAGDRKSCVRGPSVLARETGAGVRWAAGPGVRMGIACGRKGVGADPGCLDTRLDG